VYIKISVERAALIVILSMINYLISMELTSSL